MWAIFKVFTIFYNTASVSHFVFFAHELCGILAAQLVIEPTPPALEGKVLTTGPPGMSPNGRF